MCKSSVVLDLEETIISVTLLPPPNTPYLKLPIPAIRRYVYIRFRPHFAQFFDELLKNKVDVFFFTSMPKKVASPIIDSLFTNPIISSHPCSLVSQTNCISTDPQANIIPESHRFYREDCTIENGYFVKDLARISQMGLIDLNRTILIDDTLGCAQKHPHLHYQIKPWQGDCADDHELLDILPLILNRITNQTHLSKRGVLSEEVALEESLMPTNLLSSDLVESILSPSSYNVILV